ncbi:MAG TPA: hypothetical protein VFB23_09785 [Candidatus Acidoferrales bacterium]|nr:hypothetical protein [Candidatus Acidoferrales bacterium]
MKAGMIEVEEYSVRVVDIEIPVKEVADFFRTVPIDEREFTLVKAVEVGVLCLERGRTAQDTDFVKRRISELLAQVEGAVTGIPQRAEEALLQKIGSDDGQVLHPIKAVIDQASSETTRRINELKGLLAEDLDPKNAKSTLGSALQSLRDLLNPKNTESIQAVLDQAVGKATSESGALAKVVKIQVEEALKPLPFEIDSLAKEIRGKEAAAEAIQQTTLKGTPYEQNVIQALQGWARVAGAEVHHVGADNQPGDMVIAVRGDGLIPEPISVVVEARDRGSRAMGRKAISSEMAVKMTERNANAGIFLSRTQDGLSVGEIGEWAEGANEYGPWVACTHEHLVTAVRFLIVQRRLSILREAAPEIDSVAVEKQLKNIHTALGRVRTIKTKLTELGGCADAIDEQAEHLRSEIKEALGSIEDTLRASEARHQVGDGTRSVSSSTAAN